MVFMEHNRDIVIHKTAEYLRGEGHE